ncbi:MAG: 5-aminovalerate aminotransferase DavT [Pirellulaceae bacterium]|nr:MAG: 5-aminovalerate aminotransferase DavT [Pirellulaceae bacterium]
MGHEADKESRRKLHVAPDTSTGLAQGAFRAHDPWAAVEFVRGAGARLWDADGNEWIDLTCSFSVTNWGHGNVAFCQALHEQATALFHLTGQQDRWRNAAARKLCQWVGRDIPDCRVLFHSSGARAIETAIRAATCWRPGKVLAIAPGFHGTSWGTCRLSGLDEILAAAAGGKLAGAGVPRDQVVVVGNSLVAAAGRCWWKAVQGELEALLAHDAAHISALLVDPAFSTRGFLTPPASFGRWLRQRTTELGILMIADEVQSGLGRCGDWLLSRRQGWNPDLVVVGKSLGGGIYPIAATLGPAAALDALPGALVSETFAGNALGCRLACAVLELLANPSKKIFARATDLGRHLRRTLRCAVPGELMWRGRRLLTQVEGVGAVAALEFVPQGGQVEGDNAAEQEAAADFAYRCFQERLRVHWSGPKRTRCVLLSPLTMDDEELDDAMERLHEAARQFLHHR